MQEERWWVADHIHYTKLIGQGIKEEMFDLDKRLVAALDMSPHPIHFVIDVREVTRVLGLNDAAKIQHVRHPRTGWVIMIGNTQNSMVRFISSVIFNLIGARYKDCTSPEEAARFLKEQLPDVAEFSP